MQTESSTHHYPSEQEIIEASTRIIQYNQANFLLAQTKPTEQGLTRQQQAIWEVLYNILETPISHKLKIRIETSTKAEETTITHNFTPFTEPQLFNLILQRVPKSNPSNPQHFKEGKGMTLAGDIFSLSTFVKAENDSYKKVNLEINRNAQTLGQMRNNLQAVVNQAKKQLQSQQSSKGPAQNLVTKIKLSNSGLRILDHSQSLGFLKLFNPNIESLVLQDDTTELEYVKSTKTPVGNGLTLVTIHQQRHKAELNYLVSSDIDANISVAIPVKTVESEKLCLLPLSGKTATVFQRGLPLLNTFGWRYPFVMHASTLKSSSKKIPLSKGLASSIAQQFIELFGRAVRQLETFEKHVSCGKQLFLNCSASLVAIHSDISQKLFEAFQNTVKQISTIRTLNKGYQPITALRVPLINSTQRLNIQFLKISNPFLKEPISEQGFGTVSAILSRQPFQKVSRFSFEDLVSSLQALDLPKLQKKLQPLGVSLAEYLESFYSFVKQSGNQAKLGDRKVYLNISGKFVCRSHIHYFCADSLAPEVIEAVLWALDLDTKTKETILHNSIQKNILKLEELKLVDKLNSEISKTMKLKNQGPEQEVKLYKLALLLMGEDRGMLECLSKLKRFSNFEFPQVIPEYSVDQIYDGDVDRLVNKLLVGVAKEVNSLNSVYELQNILIKDVQPIEWFNDFADTLLQYEAQTTLTKNINVQGKLLEGKGMFYFQDELKEGDWELLQRLGLNIKNDQKQLSHLIDVEKFDHQQLEKRSLSAFIAPDLIKKFQELNQNEAVRESREADILSILDFVERQSLKLTEVQAQASGYKKLYQEVSKALRTFCKGVQDSRVLYRIVRCRQWFDKIKSFMAKREAKDCLIEFVKLQKAADLAKNFEVQQNELLNMRRREEEATKKLQEALKTVQSLKSQLKAVADSQKQAELAKESMKELESQHQHELALLRQKYEKDRQVLTKDYTSQYVKSNDLLERFLQPNLTNNLRLEKRNDGFYSLKVQHKVVAKVYPVSLQDAETKCFRIPIDCLSALNKLQNNHIKNYLCFPTTNGTLRFYLWSDCIDPEEYFKLLTMLKQFQYLETLPEYIVKYRIASKIDLDRLHKLQAKYYDTQQFKELFSTQTH